MDIALIGTAAMAILGPYLGKVADKFAENVGEDIWTKIKSVFRKEKELKLVEKAEDNKATAGDIVEIENLLVEHLKEDNKFLQTITESLNITSYNKFILENNLKIAVKIREELKPLYNEQIYADVASEGSYKIRIAQMERKLKEIDKKIIETITERH